MFNDSQHDNFPRPLSALCISTMYEDCSVGDEHHMKMELRMEDEGVQSITISLTGVLCLASFIRKQTAMLNNVLERKQTLRAGAADISGTQPHSSDRHT